MNQDTSEEYDNAYDEGWAAFYKELEDDKEPLSTQNPYPETDPDHGKWENGYYDADTYESGEY
jgi:hypothetical protein